MGFVDGQGGHNDVALSLEGRGETDSGSGNHDVELSNLFVSGIGIGIRAMRSWMVNLSSVRVQHADMGISFTDGFTTISMDNCFVVACRIGIRLQVDTATLTSCTIDKATQHAFWIRDGSYVFHILHSEANRYTEPVSSVIRADGPCTLQLNGFVTVGVGPEPDRGWGSSNDDVHVFLVDCRAEDGPVHVAGFGLRQERTGLSSASVSTVPTPVMPALQRCAFSPASSIPKSNIDVSAPLGVRPDIAIE